MIPILAEEADDELFLPQINTTYSVRTLDLDSSLTWLRKSRLTAFRKSRLFSEFRLAKLLSQGKITGDKMDFILAPLPNDDSLQRQQQQKQQQQQQQQQQQLQQTSLTVLSSSRTKTEQRLAETDLTMPWRPTTPASS